MIGREEERAEVVEQLNDLVAGSADRRGSLATAGEAGVGKSRLASWVCEYVHEFGLMVPLRALRPHPRAARRRHGRGQYALEGADQALVEQTLMAGR
ncbi:MAG: hypothetical protein U0235_12285 [Polyangiaceae bacterium]